jgi:hypothetical protein
MPSRKAARDMPAAPAEPPPRCFLCGRELGAKVEWHHPVPKSRGGRETVPVHPICHRAIHAALSNKELERGFATAEALRGNPEIAKFIAWVAEKEPDFHAPTRRKKS